MNIRKSIYAEEQSELAKKDRDRFATLEVKIKSFMKRIENNQEFTAEFIYSLINCRYSYVPVNPYSKNSGLIGVLKCLVEQCFDYKNDYYFKNRICCPISNMEKLIRIYEKYHDNEKASIVKEALLISILYESCVHSLVGVQLLMLLQIHLVRLNIILDQDYKDCDDIRLQGEQFNILLKETVEKQLKFISVRYTIDPNNFLYIEIKNLLNTILSTKVENKKEHSFYLITKKEEIPIFVCFGLFNQKNWSGFLEFNFYDPEVDIDLFFKLLKPYFLDKELRLYYQRELCYTNPRLDDNFIHGCVFPCAGIFISNKNCNFDMIKGSFPSIKELIRDTVFCPILDEREIKKAIDQLKGFCLDPVLKNAIESLYCTKLNLEDLFFLRRTVFFKNKSILMKDMNLLWMNEFKDHETGIFLIDSKESNDYIKEYVRHYFLNQYNFLKKTMQQFALVREDIVDNDKIIKSRTLEAEKNALKEIMTMEDSAFIFNNDNFEKVFNEHLKTINTNFKDVQNMYSGLKQQAEKCEKVFNTITKFYSLWINEHCVKVKYRAHPGVNFTSLKQCLAEMLKYGQDDVRLFINRLNRNSRFFQLTDEETAKKIEEAQLIDKEIKGKKVFFLSDFIKNRKFFDDSI